MDFSSGAMIAVHIVGEPEDSTTFSIKLSQLENVMVKNSFEFLDLASAAVTPAVAPKPGFGDDKESFSNDIKSEESLLSNMQFMILGAILGILASIIYYQFARFCQQYR